MNISRIFVELRLSTLALVAALMALCSSGCGGGAQDAAASPERQEIERLRAENQELPKLRAENEEVQRLRKDNQEISRLRAQYQELVRLRKENEQLRGQLAKLQSGSAATPRPANPARP
jgi:cell division protein FtsB